MYEIHITLDPKFAKPATFVAEMAHWKTSEIARDPVLGKNNYFYLTTYRDSKSASLIAIDTVKKLLEKDNVSIIREKIEHIVHDIRYV